MLPAQLWAHHGTWLALSEHWVVDGCRRWTSSKAGGLCSAAAEPEGLAGPCSERAKEAGHKLGSCGF